MSKEIDNPQVLLLYPKTGIDLGSTIAPPHCLLAVAAPLLKSGYRVRILDQRVEPVTEDILKRELSGDTICVGISTMVGSQIYFALKLAKTVRAITGGKVPIVWGGCQPSVIPDQFIENAHVDYVVTGEGDYTLLDMVRAWDAKKTLENIPGIVYKSGNTVIRTPPRELLDMEKLLPVPWELVNIENYIHRDMYVSDRDRVMDIGQTSRGCPFRCTFCSSAAIRQRKWRPMSAEKSIDIIVGTVKRYRLNGLWLRDDEFYIDRKRADAIFKGVIASGIDVHFYTSGTRCDVFMGATEDEIATMKRAGAHSLKFGAESGSQRILDLMQKGITTDQILATNLRCKKYGIIPVYSLMIGYPTETFEDIDKTIDIMLRLKKDNPAAKFETITLFTALPGTPSWDLAVKHGLKSPEKLEEWADWLFDDPDLKGERMPWFKKRKERVWLGNISIMSILANSLINVSGSVRGAGLRSWCRAIVRPISRYYYMRLSGKRYCFMPDLAVVRFLRKKIFFRSTHTFK